MQKALMQPVEALAGYDEIRRHIEKGSGILEISGCQETQMAHLVAGLFGKDRASLVIAENERKARELCDDLRFVDPEVLFFPARDLIAATSGSSASSPGILSCASSSKTVRI